jgi:hypothetical protein
MLEFPPAYNWEPLEAAKLNHEFVVRHDTTFSEPIQRLQGEWVFRPGRRFFSGSYTLRHWQVSNGGRRLPVRCRVRAPRQGDRL